MAELIAETFRQLEGTTHKLDGIRLFFEPSKSKRPAARRGGEGYVAPVRVMRDGAASYSPPAMLKVFFSPTVERYKRCLFLSRLELSTLPLRYDCFAAAPTGWLSGELSVPNEGTLSFKGCLSPLVEGETLEALLVDDCTLPTRIALARQLCIAVEVLEGIRFVHADLAPRNVVVMGADTAEPRLRLVDYDGFYHPDVPLVPKGSGGRTWGTPGYRARSFVEGDENSVVNSDRVALAALVMEIVTRQPEDDAHLGETFLEQEAIERGDPGLPADIVSRWPEGFDMLRHAILAPDAALAPSPRQWRVTLDTMLNAASMPAPGPLSARQPGPQRFRVQVSRGKEEYRECALQLPTGSFAQVAPELSWLSYSMTGNNFLIAGMAPPSPRLYIRHGSPDAELGLPYKGSVREQVAPGSVIIFGQITIWLS
ncbi:hypothetical protein [Polyangium sp. 15x6]|uniref:hypothetical protein n=1 Tax=Polyangium sp. 15x6 TaxID=3042687 RepID=UPI00249CC3DD|nr:hypothetical protein [Polyangium sp. 15x6]MDI3291657.1 hypothetical protein [Polyangium sp. 15x6]